MNYSFKTVSIISIIALPIIFFSCSEAPKEPAPEIVKKPVKITRSLSVTSEENAVFNMRLIGPDFKNGSEEYLLQSTPFELTIESQDVHMIMKTVEGSSPVVYKLTSADQVISGNWPTTVMIIDGEKTMTFGM